MKLSVLVSQRGVEAGFKVGSHTLDENKLPLSTGSIIDSTCERLYPRYRMIFSHPTRRVFAPKRDSMMTGHENHYSGDHRQTTCFVHHAQPSCEA